MSDTPRTDAMLVGDITPNPFDVIAFSRQLESVGEALAEALRKQLLDFTQPNEGDEAAVTALAQWEALK